MPGGVLFLLIDIDSMPVAVLFLLTSTECITHASSCAVSVDITRGTAIAVAAVVQVCSCDKKFNKPHLNRIRGVQHPVWP